MESRSEDRFCAFARLAPVGMFETNAEGACVWVNDACCALLKASADEFMGRGWQRFVHPADLDGVRKTWAESVNAECGFAADYRLIASDGEVVWAAASACALRDDAGNLTGNLGIFVDVTERRAMTEALKESERRYWTLFEHSHTPTLVIDPDTLEILEANPAAERYYGYSRDRLREIGIMGITPHTRERVLGITSVAKECDTGLYSATHRLADGSLRRVEISGGPVTLDGRLLLIGTVHDVTEALDHREELEAMVSKRTAELERALSARDGFVASMSHELRTPLNTIIGFGAVLARGMAGDLTDEQRKQAEMIYDAGRHLLALVEDLLDASALETGRRRLHVEEFAVLPLIENAVESVRPRAEAKGLEVQFDPAGDGATVRTDAVRLNQVLLNLLDNAIRYTERGHVRVGARCANGALIAEVSDTGPGMAQDEVSRIFDEYSRPPGPDMQGQRGTGIGLALSRRLARALGGDLDVVSEEGRGTTFTLTIPAELAPCE